MTSGGSSALPSSFADEAFAATAAAYSREPGSWESAVEAAIGQLFDFLASRPAQTNACIVDHCGTGPGALARRDRVLDRFVELLLPGFAATATPPRPVVAEAIAGGIYELVRGHVLERRLDDLPAAVPDAVVVVLSPFIGAERSGAAPLQRGPTPPIAFPEAESSDASETRGD
ncbi:MAG TPA: hypothetical protein VEW67_09560 [Thermoleophilaceae bacterium]|nr:hypothetical protein [Thermoleophilaceae bacterium]